MKKSGCWQGVIVTHRYFWLRAAKFLLDLESSAGSFVGFTIQFNPRNDPIPLVRCSCVGGGDHAARHCHTSEMWNGGQRSSNQKEIYFSKGKMHIFLPSCYPLETCKRTADWCYRSFCFLVVILLNKKLPKHFLCWSSKFLLLISVCCESGVRQKSAVSSFKSLLNRYKTQEGELDCGKKLL